MNEVNILTKQTENAFKWTNKLAASLPHDKWDMLAEGCASNLSWQIGHQIISIYYHTIMTTVGHIPKLIEKVNLRFYTEFCNYDTSAQYIIGKTNPKELTEHLEYMQGESLRIIKSLIPNDLKKTVEPTKVPHPVAITKFDAIDWNIKHTMWHCGQIATIKRLVDKPFDYGIQKPRHNDKTE